MNSKTTLYTILTALIMVFSIAGITPSVQAQDNPSTPVFVDAVREEPLSQTMPVIGRLVATQSGVVAARTTGPLGEFRVQVGDRVKKDDVVAVLIKDALESRRELWLAQVAQAKSRVGTSKAQLQLRDQELKRLKSLESSSAFSQAKLDDKQQEVAVMKSTIAEHRAALDVAKANLMLADIDLYNADIRAPYDSVIAVRHTNVGSFVRAGDPVITLIDDTTLEIAADVPTERIPGLTKGVSVNYVLTDNSKTGVATGWASVRAIIPDENPLTRTRSVRFSAELDQGSILAANQSVTVMIPIGAPRDVISVHKDAIINKGGNTLVYIALDGKAVIRPVKLGDAVDGRFEILNGLKIGDLVVVRGNERLRPDQAITFTSPDTAG